MLKRLVLLWFNGLIKRLNEEIDRLAYYIEYESHDQTKEDNDSIINSFKDLQYIKARMVEVMTFLECGKINRK